MKAALGIKIGMSTIFDENGKKIPISLLSQVDAKAKGTKSLKVDNYEATIAEYSLKKGKTKRCEFKKDKNEIETMKSIDFQSFKINDIVTISGKPKGKGFTGAIKRHGFSRGPETHGSDHHRHTGSIGGAYPQRVVKGRKMPGHYKNHRVTIKNVEVLEILENEKVMIVRGSIPGPKGMLLKIMGKNES
jgi:large subunit ribosomal protein L3